MAPHKEAFLVSFWFEPGDSTEAQSLRWRGSVEHLPTRRRRYFTGVVDMVAFIVAFAKKSAPDESGDSEG